MLRLLLVLCLAIGFSSQGLIDTDKASCPCLQNSTNTGKTYVLNIIKKVNWFEAMHLCHAMNMRFATVDSQQEYDFLIEMIKATNLPDPKFWISASDLSETGTYLWVSTGKPMTYPNWWIGEPTHVNVNGETEHCVEIAEFFKYKFNDDPCSRLKSFVCEK